MPIEKNDQKKKTKTTVYMPEEIKKLLDEVFIKLLRDRRKGDKSALLCEGIRPPVRKRIGSF